MEQKRKDIGYQRLEYKAIVDSDVCICVVESVFVIGLQEWIFEVFWDN